MASTFAILALVVAAFVVTAVESRAVLAPDALPLPLVLDVFGEHPLLFVRDKRGASVYPRPTAGLYPHQRTMLFTGFYRPTRHSISSDQATGVYAQGSSVGGGTYLGSGQQPQYLSEDEGPRPVDEPEIASADAEAAPTAPEDAGEAEQQAQEHDESTEQQPQEHPDSDADKPIFHESTEPQQPTSHKQPSKVHSPKKGKKMPLPPPEEEDDEEYEEDEEDEPVSPFVPPAKPGKGKKPSKQYPSLNNFFPMVFSFPRGSAAGRRGSSSSSVDSIPGMITAIANSYSTGKGGVASSVATAYGGAPTKKQKRPSSTQ